MIWWWVVVVDQVLAASRPPQFVVYHELIHTAKAFMRHVLGVERSWLMKCRQRVGQASVSKLTGGHLDHSVLMPAAGGEDKAEGPSSSLGKESSSKAAVQEPERATEEVVSEARRRFLERKNAKMAGGGGGGLKGQRR